MILTLSVFDTPLQPNDPGPPAACVHSIPIQPDPQRLRLAPEYPSRDIRVVSYNDTGWNIDAETWIKWAKEIDNFSEAYPHIRRAGWENLGQLDDFSDNLPYVVGPSMAAKFLQQLTALRDEMAKKETKALWSVMALWLIANLGFVVEKNGCWVIYPIDPQVR
jgi:hypothetical protein